MLHRPALMLLQLALEPFRGGLSVGRKGCGWLLKPWADPLHRCRWANQEELAL